MYNDFNAETYFRWLLDPETEEHFDIFWENMNSEERYQWLIDNGIEDV